MLMKENNVKFDPLHDDASTAKSSPQEYDSDIEDGSSQARSEGITEVKYALLTTFRGILLTTTAGAFGKLCDKEYVTSTSHIRFH